MTITDKDIETVSQTIMQAATDGAKGKTTYLQALVTETQQQIGKRGQEQETQLAALTAIHTRFYEIVMKTAEGFVPVGTKDRPTELHKLANFARTAASALRTHIKAGGDIMTLKPARVTKASLRARATPKPASARRLKGLAERQSKKLMAVLIGLADTDKPTAIEELRLLLGQVSSQLVALGVAATADAAQAYAEQRPFKVGKMVFAPTTTQVLSKPS